MENKITIPILGTLNVIIFLAFFFAKIYDKIDWSWWWVFSPLWIPLFLVGLFIVLFGFVWTICLILDLIKWKKLK